MPETHKVLNRLLVLLVLAAAFYFRASGLFHGLNDRIVFHPDTPKQVDKISDYLGGTWVRYRNDWNYDGYPYGLNRVDEALVRGAHLVLRPAHQLAWGDGPPLDFPERGRLFLWARAFRVLYGMTAIILTALSVRLLTRSPGAGLATLALLAVAPLGATVTHSAAGDVGVDLFFSATFFFTVVSAIRRNPAWLVAAGMAAGMAFACKYQGVFALWIPAAYACLREKPGWGVVPRLLRDGVLTAAGFVAGALALTPAFFVDPKATWRHTRNFMREVKNYRVDPEFLEQPLLRRLAHRFTHNLPNVLEALGWILAAICVLSLLAGVRARFAERNPDAAPEDSARAAVWVAVASFPLVVLPLSTALKPHVQLFHFSFLLPPLAAAAGLLFAPFLARKNPLPRLAVLAIVALLLSNDTVRSLREDWFWRRRDLTVASRAYTRGVGELPLGNRTGFRPYRGHQALLS